MNKNLIKTHLENSFDKLKFAAEIIDSGGLVIFPTETVYGIGADATNNEACKKIYSLKGRPSNNPLIVHCSDIDMIKKIAILNDLALILAAKFWPGPMSLVLPLKTSMKNGLFAQRNILASSISAGLDTVCVRIPGNEIARMMINLTKNKMIAAPSANISNFVSPTRFSHVKDVFEGIYIINTEEKECEIGIESVIIDTISGYPVILRHGSITQEKILEAISNKNEEPKNIVKSKTVPEGNASQINVKSCIEKHHEVQDQKNEKDVDLSDISPNIITAPGQLKKHYATSTILIINQSYDDWLNQKMERCVFISFGAVPERNDKIFETVIAKAKLQGMLINLSEKEDLNEAAYNLYDIMRKADLLSIKLGLEKILIQTIPKNGIGISINEKLIKASFVEI